MPRPPLPLILVGATLLLAACIGPFAGDDPSEDDGRFAAICGIEITAWNVGPPEDQALDRDARECFLEHHSSGGHAQFFVIDRASPLLRGQILTTRAGELTVLEILTREDGGPTVEAGWICRDLEATDDELVFETVDCGLSTPIGEVRPASSGVALCGTEVGRYDPADMNEAGRRCILEAFEAGTPARFFSTHLGIDGGPIASIYTVTNASVIEVYTDNRDHLGQPGLFEERCTALSPIRGPSLWKTGDCELLSSAGRSR